jgi:hypothetical protein
MVATRAQWSLSRSQQLPGEVFAGETAPEPGPPGGPWWPGHAQGDGQRGPGRLDQDTVPKAEVVLSVRTGAWLPAKARLPDHLAAAMHQGAIDLLRQAAPKATVHEGARFLGGGKVSRPRASPQASTPPSMSSGGCSARSIRWRRPGTGSPPGDPSLLDPATRLRDRSLPPPHRPGPFPELSVPLSSPRAAPHRVVRCPRGCGRKVRRLPPGRPAPDGRIAHAVAYGLRHTFATDALANGVPDAQVAELLGHSGTATLHRHYAHLGAKAKVLRDALDRVR